jgi:DNA-binding winged helix-turn-helix (wHTH) protein
VRYIFGECSLDTDTRTVARAGRPVHLGPKAFELLQVLIGMRPRVISKAELFERLWPGISVSESNLSTVVAELREALGDSPAQNRYVRTVYGFGYGFVANVTVLTDGAAAPASPRVPVVRIVLDDREVRLSEGQHVIGRAPEAALLLDDPAVSRHHARLVVGAGAVTVEDLGSRNGTWRNGTRLAALSPLEDQDVLGIGPFRLGVRIRSSAAEDTLPLSTFDAAADEPAAINDNGLAGDVRTRR